MRLSIRLRTIIALNVFVIGLAVVLGWIAQDVAGRVVEERFLKEMVGSASEYLRSTSYPKSDVLMGTLRKLYNAEWIASQDRPAGIVGSSLPPAATDEFRAKAGELGSQGVVYLGGKKYRFDSADIAGVDASTGRPAVPCRLYMLVPDARFQDARGRAERMVAEVIWPAAAAATVLAILLSFSITRPIRKLAKEMDRLGDNGGAPDNSLSPWTEGNPPVSADAKRQAIAAAMRDRERNSLKRGPKEIAQLAKSYYELLYRLGAARQRVAESERLATLGKICLSVAHELRNPLSGIKMNMRVLKDRPGLKDDPGIDAILREIDRMGLYINELMNLSPGEDLGSRTHAAGPVRLSELAGSVLTILSGRCRHAKVAVERDFPPAEEPLVTADANQVRQVMMNLMVNAIEAMPGGGTMTLRIAPGEAGLRFSVADTGKGVSAGEADIFEAFSSRKPGGVGLGLYLSKRIIDRHGGRIGYSSSSAGAVFWFELSVARASSP